MCLAGNKEASLADSRGCITRGDHSRKDLRPEDGGEGVSECFAGG